MSLHVRRPLILAVVIVGALAQFGIEMWAAVESPVPGDLAGMFAPPPFDSFTWVHSTVPILPLVTLLVIRVAMMWLFACLILGIAPSRENLLRTSGVYVCSVVVFGALLGALTWLGPLLGGQIADAIGASEQGDPYLAGARLALGMIYFFVFLPLMAFAAILLSPLIAKAASGQSMKPRLGHRSLWVLVAASALIYAVAAIGGQQKADLSAGSFLRAFVVLSLQSVIYGAIIHTTAGSAARRTLAG